MTELTIGDLAKEYGVTLRALRFWEQKGLLSPRRDGLRRLYSPSDCNRVDLIQRWAAAGFTLVQIATMLRMSDLGRTAALSAYIAERLPRLREEASAKLAGIDRLVTAMREAA